MTNDQNIKREEPPEYYVGDWCLDLSKEDINLSAVQSDVLSYCTVNGELLRVPLAMNPCGIVVNKTLLKDNGLEVPPRTASSCPSWRRSRKRATPRYRVPSSTYTASL